MLTPLILAVALGASPAEALSARFPGSAVVRSADGQRVLHASGFRAESRAPDAEGAARAFLSANADAFGLGPRQSLALASRPKARGVRAVRFHRTIDGLPVFGGDLVVGVDASNRVTLVNGADVPPAVSGRHAIGEEAAKAAAAPALGGAPALKPPVVVAGWAPHASGVRAVYRVDLVTADHEWRVTVDAETGRVLSRVDRRLRATAPARAYEVSPTETWASACPLSGASRSYCAAPVDVTLPNLATGNDLAGTQTTVYACNAKDAPALASAVPGLCSPVAAAGGGFAFQPDATYLSPSDAFAAANAYYHVDRHLSFLRSLDAALPDGTTGRALTGSIPTFVNAYSGAKPLDNGYYSSDLDGLVLGQGAGDFAYDATVLYHELTHAAVEAWGGFVVPALPDDLGCLAEPGALNEATADAMAVAETGRSEVGSFIAAVEQTGTRCLRDLDDSSAPRTCKGHGRMVPNFGGMVTAVDGLDGEAHDDGEIWSGFFWEIYRGLEASGVRGCDGACAAATAIQYHAIQLAGGTSPTFSSYRQTFAAAASSLFPTRPEVATYVDCVVRRRELDQCDRTVPLYAGELKTVFSAAPYAPFQIVLQTTGPTQYAVCSGYGKSATVHLRSGAAVQVSSTGAVDTQRQPVPSCAVAQTWYAIPGAGTWYLLFDWPGATTDPDGMDIYLVQAGTSAGMQRRPAASSPVACKPPFAQALAIAPAATTAAPNESLALMASGGTGSGYVWTFAANRSGATISQSGGYRAGLTSGVTDVVRVTDSYGDVATCEVAVKGWATSFSGATGGGCATEGGGLLAGLGVAAAAARRARRRRAP